ncbi:DUF5714 domain-containing protein [Chloroflexota bacterium]
MPVEQSEQPKMASKDNCGVCEACGAALGVGVAVSVLTGATPVKGQPRSLANEATAFALNHLTDGHPRCCKRAGRNALKAAVTFLRDKMGIVLGEGETVRCRFSARNRECPKDGCPYYAGEGD